MPENQPQVRIFTNLRDRFEDGGLIYTPNFNTNTYSDLTNASDYDPISDGLDRKQPDNPDGQPNDYSVLDGVGENADPDFPNIYNDSDEYDPTTDAKDEKFSATQTQNSVTRKKDSFVSPNSDLTKNIYSNEFSALQDLGDPEVSDAFNLASKRSSEYDPIAPGSDDKKHTVGTGENEIQLGEGYSLLDISGEEPDPDFPNLYGPDNGYYGGFLSRTGTFENYD